MTDKDRTQWIFTRALFLLRAHHKCAGCENTDCVESAAAGNCKCYDQELADAIELVKSSLDCKLYLDDMQRLSDNSSLYSDAFFEVRMHGTRAYATCANAKLLNRRDAITWAWDGACSHPGKKVLSPYSCYGCRFYTPKEETS